MEASLLIEYIITQLFLLVLIYVFFKDFLIFIKNREKNVPHNLGVVLACLLCSYLLYYTIFVLHEGFWLSRIYKWLTGNEWNSF